MKFNCDKLKDRLKQRRAAKTLRMVTWQQWYAWRPVKVAHGDCRWLEPVLRRKRYGLWSSWEYMEQYNGL